MEVLALCPRASEAQLNRAVAAARAAWHRRAITERGQIVLVWADRLEQDAESPARLLTQEKGKPLTESTASPSLWADMHRLTVCQKGTTACA